MFKLCGLLCDAGEVGQKNLAETWRQERQKQGKSEEEKKNAILELKDLPKDFSGILTVLCTYEWKF